MSLIPERVLHADATLPYKKGSPPCRPAITTAIKELRKAYTPTSGRRHPRRRHGLHR